jgi:tetratricopeptide (TPR) repeat protein
MASARAHSFSPAPANRSWIWLVVIFTAALATRLEAWRELAPIPLFRTPQLDSREYLDWASRLAAGDWSWPSPPPHGPGYPFFLAACLKFLGGIDAARFVQALGGSLDCVLVGLLAKRFFGPTAGGISGLLLAFEGPIVFHDVSILSESLLLLLSTGAVLICQESKPLRAGAAGALAAAAALVRPTALILLPIVAATLAHRSGSRKKGRRAILLCLGAAGFVLLPIALANRRATGSFLLVQGHGGLNFYMGNSPAGTGLPTARPGAGWETLETEAARHGKRLAGEQDRFYIQKALSEIAQAPVRYAGLLGRKLLWTVQADEIRETFSFSFFASQAPLLSWLPGFSWILVLALPGIFDAARQRPRPVVLFAWVGATAATCVLLLTSSRYRLPMLPPLAIFAGRGSVLLFDSFKGGARERLATGGLLAAGILTCHLSRHPPSHVFAEEWAASGYALIHEYDLEAADRAFVRAIEEDPRWSPAWGGRGVVAFDRGDLAASESLLERSVQLAPDNVATLLALGQLLESQARWSEAEKRYEEALRIAPADLPPRLGLTRALLAQGRLPQALASARLAIAASPGEPQAHLLAARALGALGRAREALPEAQIAVDLHVEDPSSWITLAMLQIDVGQWERAQATFTRAEAAGVDPRQIALGRVLLEERRRRAAQG